MYYDESPYSLFSSTNYGSKHLNVFKDSTEYGWVEEKRDVRKMIRIKTIKYGTSNSIKSYPSALNGDAKINLGVIVLFFFYTLSSIYKYTLISFACLPTYLRLIISNENMSDQKTGKSFICFFFYPSYYLGQIHHILLQSI